MLHHRSLALMRLLSLVSLQDVYCYNLEISTELFFLSF